MSYQSEKSIGDIVISGFEQGIAPSPHKGLANIQCANIATETGEVMCNYTRIQQSQVNFSGTGTLSFNSSTALNVGGVMLTAGIWITVSGTSSSGELANGVYYVLSASSGGAIIQIATAYGGSAINTYSAGLTANFTIKTNLGKPVASATEQYFNGAGTEYRYYILDVNGIVWVNDTGVSLTGGSWFAPTGLSPSSLVGPFTGLAVEFGTLNVFTGALVFTQDTNSLGVKASAGSAGYDIGYEGSTSGGLLNTLTASPNSHYAINSKSAQGIVACDTNFLVEIQASANSSSGGSNTWGAGVFTASSHTVTVGYLTGGSFPTIGSTITFTTAPGGTLYSGVSLETVYYVIATNWSSSAGTFEVSTSYGGSAASFSGSPVGAQYFNTFNACSSQTSATYVFSTQALTLPFFEIAQSLCEIGNQIVIGTQTNNLYFWQPGTATPTGVAVPSTSIPLPEVNVTSMVNVNNFAYIFAGQKGNVYLTNGSAVVPVLSIPDYCAGIPGTPSSYIEPYFTWGGSAYMRGRVFCSLQDQTASKTGNCGGIWSFIPSQAAFPQQDQGIALRLENQNSYATYNGMANIILVSQNQNANGVQYWAGWTSSISSPTYGIDFSGTTPYVGGQTIIETDAIPIGTYFDKTSFSQFEYKLGAPLATGESVQLKWRTDLTSAWSSVLTNQGETTTADGSGTVVSGYFQSSLQNAQWIQFQIILTSTNTNPSFTRLSELRIISPEEE